MASEEHNAFRERQLFQYAIDGKNRKIQKLLEREINISVDIANNKGQTLLYVSCLYQRIKVATVLMRFGADPNRRCHDGSTPTHAAAYSCSPELLKCIVEEFGGDMRLHDKQMRTPKDWAIRAGRSVNKKTIQLIDTWQEQVSRKIWSKRRSEQSGISKSLSRSAEMLKTNLKIDYCGYGSFLQSSTKPGNDRYVGVMAVVPLASPSNFATPDNLSLMFKSPPAFIMEEALWCGHKVMIKRTRGKSMSLIRATEDLLIAEARASRHLRHPNLLLLMSMCLTSAEDSYTGTPSHWLVYEPISLGSLHYVLYKTESNLSPVDAAKYMTQVADALMYMHQRGFIHCTISSHAVYLMDNLQAKLGDLFYLHCDGDHADTALPASSSFNRWVAPEVVLNENVSPATDVYGFCVLVSEALSGTMPWYGCDNASIENHIKSRRNYFVLPEWLPNSLKTLLEKGLKFYSHNRVVTIKDISICLKSLRDSGELKSIVAKVCRDEDFEVCSIKNAKVESENNCLNATYPKLQLNMGRRTDKDNSDSSYVTAGIDVPDAGPMYPTTPKGVEIEALSNGVSSELPEFFCIPSTNTPTVEIDTRESTKYNLLAPELTRRPHSCSILTQDGKMREFLPTASIRHNSYPDVHRMDSRASTGSCVMPPPSYKQLMQQESDCKTNIEEVAQPENRSMSQDQACQTRERHVGDLSQVDGCMVGKSQEQEKLPTNHNPDQRRSFNSRNGPKSLSLPVIRSSKDIKDFVAKSPPSKVYMPEHIAACRALPLTAPCSIERTTSDVSHMKCANKTLLPQLASAHGLWKKPLKNLPRPCESSQENPVNQHGDVPDCIPRRLQRTISHPGERRERDTPGMRQMVSSSALMKHKPRNSYCYGDFNAEEKYEIETTDLEEIFGSFAERRNREHQEPIRVTENEYLVETFLNKASQTDFRNESFDKNVEKQELTHPLATDDHSYANHHTQHVETMFRECYDDPYTETGVTCQQDYIIPITAGELLMTAPDRLNLTPEIYDEQHSDCRREIDSKVEPLDLRLCVGSGTSGEMWKERADDSVDGVSQAPFSPLPSFRDLCQSSVMTETTLFVCNDIAGGVSVLSSREPSFSENPEAQIGFEVLQEKSIGSDFVTCQEIDQKDIDDSKIQDAPTDSIAIEVIIDDGTEAAENKSSKIKPSGQFQEAGEQGTDAAQDNMCHDAAGHGFAKSDSSKITHSNQFQEAGESCIDTVLPRLDCENYQRSDFGGLPSADELKNFPVLKSSNAEYKKVMVTPSKWSFEKKLCLFKVVADSEEMGLGKKVLNKNTYSKVQRAIKQFEGPDSPRESKIPVSKNLIIPCGTQDFLQEESVNDSSCAIDANRLIQDKIGSTFKTSTPVSQHHQAIETDLVKCRDATNPKSFEEVRAEIEAVSDSKYSQLEESSQNPSKVTFDLPPEKKEDFPNNNTDEIPIDHNMSSFFTEESDDTYDQLRISPNNVHEIRPAIQNIVKDITERAFATVERKLNVKIPMKRPFDEGENLETNFCVTDDGFTKENDALSIGEDSECEFGRSPTPENLFCEDNPTQKPCTSKKVASSLPARLDRISSKNPNLHAGKRLHSYPDITTTFDCSSMEGDGQECSSFVSDAEDPQSSRFYRSIDTSIWSM